MVLPCSEVLIQLPLKANSLGQRDHLISVLRPATFPRWTKGIIAKEDKGIIAKEVTGNVKHLFLLTSTRSGKSVGTRKKPRWSMQLRKLGGSGPGYLPNSMRIVLSIKKPEVGSFRYTRAENQTWMEGDL